MKQYRFISDPGHAWLEVPQAELGALRIKPSSYSYQNEGMVYLEEDCDASLFIDAQGLTSKDIVEVYQDPTPIRGYAHWNGGAS